MKDISVTGQPKGEITPAAFPIFWRSCQAAVLLALKEQGMIEEFQYRSAMHRLRQTQYDE